MAAAAGDRRDHGQEDWSKDAPTDAAANQKQFGDKDNERNGDQKRSARRAHAGSEKDERKDGGEWARRPKKNDVAPVVRGRGLDPGAKGPKPPSPRQRRRRTRTAASRR